MRNKIILAALASFIIWCIPSLAQQSPGHFLIATNMYQSVLPNINTLTYGQLDGITTRFDGYGGWFVAITNSSATIDNVNVFGITNSAGQSGRWIRVDLRGTGTNGPVGPAGGALTLTYPNPGVDLGTGAYITGNLPISNIVQIADNSLLGNFTGGTADIQVLTSITSANVATIVSDETGTGKLVFNNDPRFTNTVTVIGTITNSALTAGRFTMAGTGSILTDDADATFSGDTATFTKIVGSTSITDSGLTATRVTFAGTGGLLSDDSDFTFTGGNTLSSPLVVASTSVSTPLIITASGDLSVTPAAGSSVHVRVSGTGDFIVNTNLIYADSSLIKVGIKEATPDANLHVSEGVGTVPSLLAGHIMVIQNNDNTDDQSRLLLLGGAAGYSVLDFGDASSSNVGALAYEHDGDSFYINTGGANRLKMNSSGTGLGFASSLATLAINGGLHVGGESNPGDNNAIIDGTLENTGLITATASLTYPSATASTAAVWNGSKVLISSVTTLTELSYVSGVTSAIQTQLNNRVILGRQGNGDPNALAVAGDSIGQTYLDIDTGNQWIYQGSTYRWIP